MLRRFGSYVDADGWALSKERTGGCAQLRRKEGARCHIEDDKEGTRSKTSLPLIRKRVATRIVPSL